MSVNSRKLYGMHAPGIVKASCDTKVVKMSQKAVTYCYNLIWEKA